MKSIKQYLEEVNKKPLEIKNQTLSDMYNDLQFSVTKEKQTSVTAATYYRDLSKSDKLKFIVYHIYYNNLKLPITKDDIRMVWPLAIYKDKKQVDDITKNLKKMFKEVDKLITNKSIDIR